MAEEASSLVGVLETTVDLKSSAEKFHNSFVGKPYFISSNVQSAELQEGEIGQVGAVTVWTYVFDGEVKVMKERIESIDLDTNEVKFKVLDGDLLKEYKNFMITFRVTTKEGESGSVGYIRYEYEKINEEVADAESLIQASVEVFKQMDEHLLSEE